MHTLPGYLSSWRVCGRDDADHVMPLVRACLHHQEAMISTNVSELAKAQGLTTEQAVDADINGFDAYQQRVLKNWDPGNDAMVGVPLSGHERALIKTYLAYKLGVGPRNAPAKGNSGG